MNCTFPASSGGGGQWTSSGNNIYSTNSGNVGIATASPDALLTFPGSQSGMKINLYQGTKQGFGTASSLLFTGLASTNDRFGVGVYDGASGLSSEVFTVRGNGNVGIGTTSPGAPLDLYASTTGFGGSNQGGLIFRAQDGLNRPAIAAYGNIDGSQFSYNVASAVKLRQQAGTGWSLETTGSVGVGGSLYVRGSVNAFYQDVAEWVPAHTALAPGTVVVISATETNVVEASHEAYDTAVVGVVSPQPGLVLGEPGEGKVLVSQSGRVRVKVDASYGAVRQGDLLVTSPVAGVAMRSAPLSVGGASFHRPGTLIGKALEPLPSGQGEILVLLTLQ